MDYYVNLWESVQNIDGHRVATEVATISNENINTNLVSSIWFESKEEAEAYVLEHNSAD